MQHDATDETKVVIPDGQTDTGAEGSTEGTGTTEGTQEGTEPKDEGVKLSPAEFRHYKKWKDSQKQPAPQQQTQPRTQSSSKLEVEEAVLLSQGVSEELIEELKLRAPQHGGSLIRAQKDPKFVAVKEQFEKEQKQKNASLPASRGAGTVSAAKTFNSPTLTREEHRKMVLESQS